MVIAGIAGSEGKTETAGIISSILNRAGTKYSHIDSKSLLSYTRSKIKAFIAELARNNIDLLIIKINHGDTERFISNEINFDIMIFAETLEKASGESESSLKQEQLSLLQLLKEKGTVIVNDADTDLIGVLYEKKKNIVTYGFCKSSCITTSSIGDDLLNKGFICCLQEAIATRNGKLLEPQEYKLTIDTEAADTNHILAAASFAIVNGIDLNDSLKSINFSNV